MEDNMRSVKWTLVITALLLWRGFKKKGEQEY